MLQEHVKTTKTDKTRFFFAKKRCSWSSTNNCYLMSHFNQPNIERKNCVSTTKYKRLLEMCIVQHVEMKSVFTMESFTIELVSNTCAQLFPDNTLSSFTNYLPEQLNLEGQWEVAISEMSYPLRYQNVTEGKFMFFGKKLSESSEFYYVEIGLYPSITDVVEAMNILIQERHNHSENCITVKVSRGTQKVEINLANEGSSLAFFSKDLGHIFGRNVGNEFGVMLRGKGPHKPEFAYNIVRIHSLMIYTDLIEYNIVGDTKAPLLRCFPFISELKSGDILTIGQYMNYQTFSNLQFRPLFKNSFHSIHIDLRDTSGEKHLLYLSVSLVLF